MKTKDEIIDWALMQEGGVGHVSKAMDEYAKQQAMEFAKWTAINLWSVHGDNWYPYQNEDNPVSADELYNLFIESQNE